MRLELIQKQMLTLAMQNSVNLLQMNNLRIQEYLNDALNSNPLLEFDYSRISDKKDPFTPRLNKKNSDTQSIDKERFMEEKEAVSSPLQDLQLQLMAMELSPSQRSLLNYLIASLDQNGYLSETPEEISRSLGLALREVQAAITILQSMEPAGIGARDLKECLMLQLRRDFPNDQTNQIAVKIVEEHLESLAKGNVRKVAKILGCTEKTVELAWSRIKKLTPKPMNGLGLHTETNYILPDFYIVEEDGCFKYILNDFYLPKIKISETYFEILQSGVLKGNEAEYFKSNYNQAKELIRFLTYRASTLQKVVEYVIDVQYSFFKYGPGHRVSMSNRQIAEYLNLHESTISRAVSGKYFECKWGVFALKDLFSHSVKAADQIVDVDYDVIISLMKEIIAGEPADTAYSDREISCMMMEKGIQLSRRTIAKYRQSLGIEKASARKQSKK